MVLFCEYDQTDLLSSVGATNEPCYIKVRHEWSYELTREKHHHVSASACSVPWKTL